MDEELYSRSGVVYRRINRPSKEAVAAIGASPVADVHEAMGAVLGYRQHMRPGMNPIRKGQHVAGPAVTAFQFPGDNMMMHLALGLTEPGDMLVINSFWGLAPQWGANAASWAVAHGVAGLIVDGAVRDNAEVAALGFPVWATTIAAGQVQKGAGAGAVNIPISCGGVIVNPGDIVVADEDGVVVVPRAIADDIAAVCLKKTAFEKHRKGEFAKPGGISIFDTYYKEPFAKFGMTDIDKSWDD